MGAIGQRFDLQLAVLRYTEGATDDYNQPVASWPLAAVIPGHVREASEREAVQSNQAGAVVASHVIYTFPTVAVTPRDRIRHEPDDGRVYDVTGVNEKPGRDHATHLQIDAVLVTA